MTMQQSSPVVIVIAFLIFVSVTAPLCCAVNGRPWKPWVGVNYGRLGSDLPMPEDSVRLIRSMGFRQVKIFDSDPAVLTALSKTRLGVVMAATNEEIETLALSESSASEWVQTRVAPFLGNTRIRAITVGNELLSRPELNSAWPMLVPAMNNLQQALTQHPNTTRVKISTCVAMDVLTDSYPPSAGRFREEVAEVIVRPLLSFLSKTRSFLFVNAYPYLAYSGSSSSPSLLEYALFQGEPVQDGDLVYKSLLDAQMDAFISAMEKMGFADLKIAVSETGWPTAGGPGASVENARVYNERLLEKMAASLPLPGTPRRPGVFVPTFIFALFNENQKPGADTEKHWGLLYPNTTNVYSFSLPSH